MKKLLFLLPLLAISSIGISGCKSSKKARITYGTLVDTEATELDYGALAAKVAKKENLLISVYQDGVPCGCWTTFKSVIDQYVDQYDTKIYYIKRSQFSDDSEKWGLTILNDTTEPTFALIKDGKKANEFVYGKDNKPLFTTLKGLREAIVKIARDPQYMLVDQSYLDKALFEDKNDKVVVHYIWNFCPDCNDCLPNVLLPYSEKNEFKTKVWVIDLGIKGILLDAEGKFIGTGIQTYVDFLKIHKMSKAGDETFGYDRGFVPTTQVWEKGELKDMTVYFNDAVSLENDKYTITRSYYDSDRVENLQYTSEVLLGRELPKEEIDATTNKETGITTYSWNAEYARNTHQKILESFLTTYVK